ncbi:hypothetical protein NRB_27260 [Novosphingobium sp. 11B]
MDQAARERLHVAARNGLHQQEFNDLMIRQSLRPAIEQPLAQPCAVAARIIGKIAARLPEGEGAFIEEGRLSVHAAYKQLPFPSARRK